MSVNMFKNKFCFYYKYFMGMDYGKIIKIKKLNKLSNMKYEKIN